MQRQQSSCTLTIKMKTWEQPVSIFQLCYVSSLVEDSPALLSSILDQATRNNSQKNITGMMVYSGGNVMQVLEGEKDAVLNIFRSIEMDTRHKGIFVLIKHEIPERQFASWSMGFKHFSKADLGKFSATAHIFEARQEEITKRGRDGEVLALLKSFTNRSVGL